MSQSNRGRRNVPLSEDQAARARGLREVGMKKHDADALVYWWDRIPLERRLEMFEMAGNEAEAAIVRSQLERERQGRQQ